MVGSPRSDRFETPSPAS